MKKLSILLIAAMVLSFPVFAGGSSEASVVNEDGTVDIDLWYGAAVTEAGPIPEDWVGYDIIRDELGINLHLTVLPSSDQDQNVKIQAAGAGNNLPDVFLVQRPVLINLVNQGLIAPLDEDFFAAMPTRTAKYHDADSINHATIDGTCWGMAVPAESVGIEFLCVRQDWLDNLGLEVPTTLDEFFDVMYAFTYDDPDGNGLDDTYGFGAFIESNATLKGYPGSRLWPIMGAFNVPGLWDFHRDNLGLSLLNPDFYNFMQFMKKCIDAGVIDPNWLSYKKDDFRAAWKQGRFGMMYEQWAALSAEANYAPFDANFPDGEWKVINPPEGPDGYAYTGALDKTYRIYAVSERAAEAGKLPYIEKLFEWMGTDEAYYLLGYGVEGENYVLDENGQVSTEGLGDNAFTGGQGQVMTQLRNMVFFNTPDETAVRFPDYVCANSGKTMSPVSYCIAASEVPWKMAVGSGIMPTPNSDVQRFMEQGLAEFFSGQRELTPENWQSFIDDFLKMGGEAWNQEGIEFAEANNLVID